MKRYRIYHDSISDSIEEIEDSNGLWVKYSEVVNDPGHIPSMQVNELCRKLESLQTSIEKGHMEAGRRVWEAMSGQCYWEHDGTCRKINVKPCTYNNCPLLKGINQ